MHALLVDLDDTLIDDVRARDQALRSTLQHLGADIDIEPALTVVREEWRASELRGVRQFIGVSSWEALWTDFDAAVVAPRQQDAGRRFQERVWKRLAPNHDHEAAATLYASTRAAAVTAFAWVRPTLVEWQAHGTLWCVTNGSSWLQRHKLSLARIEDLFTLVITSGDLGAEKAEPGFSKHVTAALAERQLRAVVVIGDSPSSDGALATALDVPFARATTGRPPDWLPD